MSKLHRTRRRLRLHAITCNAITCNGGAVGAISSLATALRLRPFRESDLDAYAAMCADEEVMRHIGAGGPVGVDVAWRHGYAFEAARAARNYGRDALGLSELISLIRPDNTRSVALAQRLGAIPGQTIEFMEQACLVYRHPEP